MQNRVGKSLKLQFVGVGIFAQRPPIHAIFDRKTLDDARLVEPGQIDLARHAAVFAIDAKSFLKVAANGDREVDVAETPVRELGADEPAVRVAAFQQAGLQGHDGPRQQACRVDQVSRMREDEVPTPVRLGIACQVGAPVRSGTPAAEDCPSSCSDKRNRSTKP